MDASRLARYAYGLPDYPQAKLPNRTLGSSSIAAYLAHWNYHLHWRITNFVSTRLLAISLTLSAVLELTINSLIDSANTCCYWLAQFKTNPRQLWDSLFCRKNLSFGAFVQFQQRHFTFTNHCLQRFWQMVKHLNPCGLRHPQTLVQTVHPPAIIRLLAELPAATAQLNAFVLNPKSTRSEAQQLLSQYTRLLKAMRPIHDLNSSSAHQFLSDLRELARALPTLTPLLHTLRLIKILYPYQSTSDQSTSEEILALYATLLATLPKNPTELSEEHKLFLDRLLHLWGEKGWLACLTFESLHFLFSLISREKLTAIIALFSQAQRRDFLDLLERCLAACKGFKKLDATFIEENFAACLTDVTALAKAPGCAWVSAYLHFSLIPFGFQLLKKPGFASSLSTACLFELLHLAGILVPPSNDQQPPQIDANRLSLLLKELPPSSAAEMAILNELERYAFALPFVHAFDHKQLAAPTHLPPLTQYLAALKAQAENVHYHWLTLWSAYRLFPPLFAGLATLPIPSFEELNAFLAALPRRSLIASENVVLGQLISNTANNCDLKSHTAAFKKALQYFALRLMPEAAYLGHHPSFSAIDMLCEQLLSLSAIDIETVEAWLHILRYSLTHRSTHQIHEGAQLLPHLLALTDLFSQLPQSPALKKLLNAFLSAKHLRQQFYTPASLETLTELTLRSLQPAKSLSSETVQALWRQLFCLTEVTPHLQSIIGKMRRLIPQERWFTEINTALFEIVQLSPAQPVNAPHLVAVLSAALTPEDMAQLPSALPQLEAHFPHLISLNCSATALHDLLQNLSEPLQTAQK